jgi:hypothetical protein
MLSAWLERRCDVGVAQALSRKAVFGIFIKLFDSINMVAIYTYDKIIEYRLKQGD